jgi:hypothetical protein
MQGVKLSGIRGNNFKTKLMFLRQIATAKVLFSGTEVQINLFTTRKQPSLERNLISRRQ